MVPLIYNSLFKCYACAFLSFHLLYLILTYTDKTKKKTDQAEESQLTEGSPTNDLIVTLRAWL